MKLRHRNCFIHFPLDSTCQLRIRSHGEYSSFLWVKDSGTVLTVPSFGSQSLLCSSPNSSGELSHFAGLVLDLLVIAVKEVGASSVLEPAQRASFKDARSCKRRWNLQLRNPCAVCLEKADHPPVFIKSF